MSTEILKNKLIISYMYVAKMLKNDPVRAVKFILENRSMFKISDEDILKLRSEHSITDEMLEEIVIEELFP